MNQLISDNLVYIGISLPLLMVLYFIWLRLHKPSKSEVSDGQVQNNKASTHEKKKAEGKYLSLVLHRQTEKGQFEKLFEAIGAPWVLLPSLDKHGQGYFVIESKKDPSVLVPYGPSDTYEAMASPQMAHFALSWGTVKIVFNWTTDMWEKVNTVLATVCVIGGFLTAIIIIGQVTGH